MVLGTKMLQLFKVREIARTSYAHLDGLRHLHLFGCKFYHWCFTCWKVLRGRNHSSIFELQISHHQLQDSNKLRRRIEDLDNSKVRLVGQVMCVWCIRSSLFGKCKHMDEEHLPLCVKDWNSILIMAAEPWLAWLSGLRPGLWTKRLLVWFPVRARAWFAGQVPSWGNVRSNWLMYISPTDVSLPLSLPFPLLKSK